MKTKLMALCTALLLATVTWLGAHENDKAKACSADFERLKTLVGTWTGTTDMGQGPIDMTITYRLLASGSVLEERVFAGTPNEMITMFYERDGKLALTHYCVIGNRPAMTLKSSDAKSLTFDLDEKCGINTASETHMASMKLTFDNPDSITASCKLVVDGKVAAEHPTTLKRVKS